jgi:hypothetical protein
VSTALVVLLYGAFTSGCVSTTYCIRRSALVPIPAPSQRPAALATGIIEGSVADDTVIWASPPERVEQANIGLYVPRTQLQGTLLLSPHRSVSLGFVWETGLAAGAIPISPSSLSQPDDSTGGAGLHMSFHIPISERFVLDLGCELLVYSIPSRVAFMTCDSDPDATQESGEFQTATTTLLARIWLGFGVDLGWSHLTIALGGRPHPTNVEVSLETHTSSKDIQPEIDYEFYPYLYLGWELHLARWAHLSVGIYQMLNFDPVRYAPIVGINLRLNHLSTAERYRRDRTATPTDGQTRNLRLSRLTRRERMRRDRDSAESDD